MKNKFSRKLLFTTIALAFLTILLSIIVNLFTGKKDVTDWLEHIKLSYLVGAVIIIGIVSILLAYLQVKYAEKADEEKEILAENIEPDVKRLYDSLKERYKKRYESKLDGRFEIKLEVSEDWHSDKPQSYKFDARAKISPAVETVRKAFDEKGRLLIVGSPGSGKTVLLLNLAIQLLGDEFKTDRKLPVIFNLASWSEEYKNFGDWLNAMLVTNYGFYKKYAKELLKEKKIVFLLDGLDELGRNEKKEKASEKRAKCLASLNEYLRDGRRAVISCRIEEFKKMKELTGQDAPVSAKVEVFDLSKAQVLLALEHAKLHKDIEHHASAENLLKRLVSKENDNLLEVLSTPFYFTTAMEIFDQEILSEKKLPERIDEIKKHLIANFVEVKIKNEENLSEFELNKISYWLKWLAGFLEKKQLVSFELSELQKEDKRELFLYNLLYNLIFFLVSFISFFCICFFISTKMSLSVIIGFICATVLSFVSINGFRPNLSEWSFKPFLKLLELETWAIIIFGFGCFNLFIWGVGIIVELGFMYFLGFFKGNDIYDVIVGTGQTTLLLNLIWMPLGIAVECSEAGKFDYIRFSYQRLRSKFLFTAFVSGLVCFWCSLVVFPLYDAFGNKLPFDVAEIKQHIWLFLILISLLAGFFSTPFYRHFIVRLSLLIQGKIPLKYATFLDYAAEARILEKDGGQWRFRHQNLQEYFANLEI